MKLTDEQIKRLGDGYRAMLDHNITVPMAAVHIVDLCDTIEALRLENERLKDDLNAFTHIEQCRAFAGLATTVGDLQQENERLKAQVARYKDLSTVKDEYIKLFLAEEKELVGIAAIHGWRGNLDRCDKGAELKAKIAELEIALSDTPADYHNPGDG